MKILKLIAVLIFLTTFSTFSFAEEKPDCSQIKNNTLVGNLKTFMCKRNSDKLDKDGNFKEGLFKIFKKKS